MNEGEGEAIRTWKPEFERLISNLLSKNCGETPADPAALALLEDVGLSLLFNILGEADGIARFKNASNIGGDHVRVAVDLIGARMNLMREDDNSIADTASINATGSAFPTSSAAQITIRRAINRGSSPPSIIRAK